MPNGLMHPVFLLASACQGYFRIYSSSLLKFGLRGEKTEASIKSPQIYHEVARPRSSTKDFLLTLSLKSTYYLLHTSYFQNHQLKLIRNAKLFIHLTSVKICAKLSINQRESKSGYWFLAELRGCWRGDAQSFCCCLQKNPCNQINQLHMRFIFFK